MKLFFNRYLFAIIVLIISALLIIVGLNQKEPQTSLFLIGGIAMLICGVMVVLLSSGKIKGIFVPILTITFLGGAIAFVYFNYTTINNEISFSREKDYRYNEVKERLLVIRAAQLAYKDAKKTYATSFDSLVDFVKNGKLSILKMEGNEEDSLAVAQGKISREIVEIPVLGSYAFDYKGYPVDSLPYIPYGNGSRFSLETGSMIINNDSSLTQPTMLVSANFRNFLSDLGEKYNKEVPDSLIKLGSLTEATTNGNWR